MWIKIKMLTLHSAMRSTVYFIDFARFSVNACVLSLSSQESHIALTSNTFLVSFKCP